MAVWTGTYSALARCMEEGFDASNLTVVLSEWPGIDPARYDYTPVWLSPETNLLLSRQARVEYN